MKKIMWIVAVLPVVVASMMLQVIPDMIPHKIGIFYFSDSYFVCYILLAPFNWYIRKKDSESKYG